MPNVNDGLAGASDADVNTESGFAAALAELRGEPLSADALKERESDDRSVQAGLSTGDDDALVLEAPVVAPEPVVESPAVAPELQAFLEQHDGDVNKALEAALKEKAEAQGVIGRQSGELGDLRQFKETASERLARLEGRLEAAPVATPQPVPVVDDATRNWIEENVTSRGGAATMGVVAQQFPHLIDATLDVWKAEDPVGAAEFAARKAYFELQAQDEQRRAQNAPTDDPLETLLAEREQRQRDDAFNATLNEVVEATDPKVWDVIKDKLVPLLADETVPKLVKDAVAAGDKEGIKMLFEIAHNRAVQAGSEQARTTEAQRAADAKRSATVTSGSLQPVPTERQSESGELTSAERQQRFRENLLRTETTSVRDGLVVAK